MKIEFSGISHLIGAFLHVNQVKFLSMSQSKHEFTVRQSERLGLLRSSFLELCHYFTQPPTPYVVTFRNQIHLILVHDRFPVDIFPVGHLPLGIFSAICPETFSQWTFSHLYMEIWTKFLDNDNNYGRVKIYGEPGPGPSIGGGYLRRIKGGRRLFLEKN